MVYKTVHIEKKSHYLKTSVIELKKRLIHHLKKNITATDASVLSGIPINECEQALLALAKDYPSRIQITREGILQFCFHSLQNTREPPGYVRMIQNVKRLIKGIFEQIVTIVTLFISIPLLISVGANAIGLLTGLNDRVPPLAVIFFLPLFFISGICISIGGAWMAIIGLVAGIYIMLISGIFLLVMAVISLITTGFTGTTLTFIICSVICIGVGLPMSISATRYVRKLFTKGTNFILRFWKMVGGFIFGHPPRIKDQLEDERLVTGLISENKGILVISDLMDLFGWDYYTAESNITRILIDYRGDIGVTDKGAIIYRFTSLIKKGAGQPVSPAYGRLRKEKSVFFNCPRFFWISMLSVLIPGFLGVLLHPDLILFPGIEDYISLSTQYWDLNDSIPLVLFQGLGVYIYIIPIGVPLIRLIFLLFYSIKKHIKMTCFGFIHRVVTQPEGFYSSQINPALLARLNGIIDENKTNEKGEFFLIFPIIELEQNEAAQLKGKTLSIEL